MTCIIILGMHRSGTSCLTGSLQNHGLYLGAVNDSAPHNKKGNKENNQTWSINDYVLDLSGGAWDSPPSEVRWDQTARSMRDEFLSQFTSQTKWGFKDPRTMLTLPFWLEGLTDYRLVATFRHPALVAKSLAARNGFGTERSIDLWLFYNRLLLSYLDRFNVPLINFDLPKDHYLRAVHKIARKLELNSTSTQPATRFFDETLQHQIIETADNQRLPNAVEVLYTDLVARSRRWMSD